MSNKLPMMNVEKTKLQLVIPAITRAQLERLARTASLSVNEYGNALLDRGLREIPTTKEDVSRANEIIEKNIQARAERKRQKGIK